MIFGFFFLMRTQFWVSSFLRFVLYLVCGRKVDVVSALEKCIYQKCRVTEKNEETFNSPICDTTYYIFYLSFILRRNPHQIILHFLGVL